MTKKEEEKIENNTENKLYHMSKEGHAKQDDNTDRSGVVSTSTGAHNADHVVPPLDTKLAAPLPLFTDCNDLPF
jgi:hypothetical protein